MLDTVLVIGKGTIGYEYRKILEDLGVNTAWEGRNYSKTISGNMKKKITHVIIATPVLPMIDIVKNINKTFSNEIQILVEKPFSYSLDAMRSVLAQNNNIFVGLNRRMYSNIIELKTILENETVKTLHFDFSEPTKLFGINLSDPTNIDYHNAFYYQSVHLIDLAFYLMGNPKFINSQISGEFTKNGGGICSGYGISKLGTHFTFQADWNVPGYWNIFITTTNFRISVKSINEIQVSTFNSNSSEMTISNHVYNLNYFDNKYKPGFYNQVLAFTKGNCENLCNLRQYITVVEWMRKIVLQHGSNTNINH